MIVIRQFLFLRWVFSICFSGEYSVFLRWVFCIFFSGEYFVFFSHVIILYFFLRWVFAFFSQVSFCISFSGEYSVRRHCALHSTLRDSHSAPGCSRKLQTIKNVENSYFLLCLIVFPSGSSILQLVATLNKLFGTFDQLAQVKKIKR